MDHLPQSDTLHIRVPFVAEPGVFSPEDFFSLPSSIGLSVTQLLQDGPGKIPAEKAPGFLQSWLFFSLLAQVLNTDIDTSQFLQYSHGNKEVNTGELLTMFEKSPEISWQAVHRPSLRGEDPERYRRVRASLALDEARNFVLAWCSDKFDDVVLWKNALAKSEDGDANSQSLFRHRHRELCLSFGIIGESLDRFCTRHRPWAQGGNEADLYGSWQDRVTDQRSWGFSALLCQRMVNSGWCPNDAWRIHVTAGDLSSMYYVNSFHPASQSDHSSCDAQQCQLRLLPATSQHTAHCPDDDEGLVVPDQDKLNDIIAAGNIPILKFNNKEELSLSEYVLHTSWQDGDDGPPNCEETPRFVAISHVWADGLGPSEQNNEQNRLPRCQLIRIRDTLKKDPETKDQHFWIDSLCVPEQTDIRNKAIQMMGQVYSHAYTVLVLDSTLRTTSSIPETLEAIVRINTGIWSTRMWTLPEGVRARRLHFDFKDGLLSTTDLRRRYEKAKRNPLDREHHVYKAGWLFSPYIFSMRNKIDELHSLSKKRSGTAEHEQVAHIWQAMQWRETSRPEDEALCLARLLDIDPLPLLKIEASSHAELAQKRMVEFLDLLDQNIGIPPGMIFLPGPKLTTKGVAWAPSSWMCKRSREVSAPMFVAEQRLSFLTRNGLHVQYRGIRLHPGRKALKPRFWIPTARNLSKWYRVEFIPDSDKTSWPEIWERACSGDELPAIIRSRFDRHDESELALLVKGVRRRNEELNAASSGSTSHARQDVWWTRILCRLWICWETDHAVAARLTEEFRYNIDMMTWGESLDSSQRWVVDGVSE